MLKHSVPDPGLAEFESLRQNLRQEYLSHFDTSLASFDDFTYGIPKVLSWGEGSRLKVGKFCSISENVTMVLGGEHNIDWATTYPFCSVLKSFSDIKGHPKTKGDIVIGNDVWVGDGAKILSGVKIGDGCVIGGGALVTKNMPPYSICGGNPANIIRFRFDEKTVVKLLQIRWWDWSIHQVYKAVPLLQSNNINGLFDFYETNVRRNDTR